MPKEAGRSVPEFMSTLTPYLTFNGDCTDALEFYPKAFGARILFPPMRSGGKIIHAMAEIGNSKMMMSDYFGGKGPDVGNALSIWMYVDDCDAVFNRAVEAGAKVTMEMKDQFWGDRVGEVEDPFGYRWSIASQKWELSPEEMKKAQEEWIKEQRL